MDDLLLSRMRERLQRLRKVAAMSHDPRIIELVSQTADEIETDIHRIKSADGGRVNFQLEPPPEK